MPRVSFTVRGANAVGWHAGQQVYVRSHAHGLSGRVGGVIKSDFDTPYAGSSTPQPFNIARLTRQFTKGGSRQVVTAECGFRRNLYQG